ncbi:conserved hypothetical protein [Candidatus Desulfarcum epimagneticum]|uniref:AMP-dependent synthetase n=1 Tax=uncultured Desulfobacteraceae bacterium TaxID=218296 RepID=A0A484HJI6_9BACT|nr:conserved hypothetical protein [uncultured Desulfobacteraceae bacterium]
MRLPFILEKALSLYADKEAVISGENRFTYRQFARRVFCLAGFLKSRGIGPGHRVAILHPNTHEFLECYFAAAELGAILVPLNSRLSPVELGRIMKDSGAVFLVFAHVFLSRAAAVLADQTLISGSLCSGAGDGPFPPGTVDYEKALEGGDLDRPRAIEGDDDEIAHLYYTSGTTGEPKGVALSHKNVSFHALAAIAELRLCDADVWIHAAPLFHLADAWAAFAVTWVGGTHVMTGDFEPGPVLSAMENERVTITNMIPAMLNMLLHDPGVKNRDFSGLRLILSGGAPMAPALVKKIMETFKCDYCQTYGMTETSPYLALSILKDNLARLDSDQRFFYKAKTGRPFLGTLLKVAREDGSEVARDDEEVGEIMVRGDIVTKGYWNKPAETSRAFKDGWLRTGDMAVIDREGYVNIVDRKKDMIITGGENVYSIEVENVLYSHPAILEAAVIGVPDPQWGEALTAVVSLKEGHEAREDEIIGYFKSRGDIAGFKIPKSVIFVPGLPKTGSGKISKKKLKEKWAKPGDGP